MTTSKNLWVIPTDKPSRLGFDSVKNLHFVNDYIDDYQNIYITNSEKPKEGEWCIDIDKFTTKPILNTAYSDDVCPTHIKQLKVILTDNEYLIKNGIQSIEDDFLEWFCKNSNCEYVEIDLLKRGIYDEYKYKIIIPKVEPKQKLIEEVREEPTGLVKGCYPRRGKIINYIPKGKINEDGIWIPNDLHENVDETKQDSQEYDLLQHIKFCLVCNNESQAIRLIEKYKFRQTEELLETLSKVLVYQGNEYRLPHYFENEIKEVLKKFEY